jgi:hypothetical protein
MTPTKKNLILVAVVSVIVVPVFLVLYRWTAPRVDHPSPAYLCSQNLRQIDAAKQMWGLEHGTNAIPSWDDIHTNITRTASDPLPKCPGGGVYSIGPIGEIPTCSIAEHTAAYRASAH